MELTKSKLLRHIDTLLYGNVSSASSSSSSSSSSSLSSSFSSSPYCSRTMKKMTITSAAAARG
eukprot:11559619-Prorocentrum_lima.AAC.1